MDPCGYLTDIQYLQHMIPHHQMALDMSQQLSHTSKWPELLVVARQISWAQDIEIKIMNAILHEFMEKISSNLQQKNQYIATMGDTTYPNRLEISNLPCQPEFFEHSHTAKVITDEAYISHMIPHHQIAVDMSKRLLKHTSNDYMIDLAYNIIRNQQAEITRLSALSKSAQRFQSDLL